MTKDDYKKVGVEEVRQELRDRFGIDEETLTQTKGKLVTLLLEKIEDEEADEDIPFDDTLDILSDAVDSEALARASSIQEQPAFNSPKWSSWVMDQFEDNEMENEAPTCDGLRRMTESILGPLTKVEIVSNTAPSLDNGGIATVAMGVTIHDVRLESHPAFGLSLYFEDISDASRKNITDEDVAKHLSATAATRAESRAYRKLLRLRKVLSAEEKDAGDSLDEDEWSVSEPIEDRQINVIDTLCRRLDIDVMGFVNSGQHEYATVFQVNRDVAAKMVKWLNLIQQSKREKPESVGSYIAGWRDSEEEKNK